MNFTRWKEYSIYTSNHRAGWLFYLSTRFVLFVVFFPASRDSTQTSFVTERILISSAEEEEFGTEPTNLEDDLNEAKQ